MVAPLRSSHALMLVTSSGRVVSTALLAMSAWIFRDKSPYTFPGGVAKIVNKNAARVAEVIIRSGYSDNS